LYHEKVKILRRLKDLIWKENKVEMKVKTMADVVLIFEAPIPSLLHQNNIGITYVRTSNLRMELIRYVPLFFVVRPQSIITIAKTSCVLTFVHIVDGVKSKP
jgi:hypothetical protein